MRRRENNFDFLRQFAALLVILGHSQSLVGVPQFAIFGHGIATIGVLIFFSLSGFLIAQSWERDPAYLSFIVKRSLRIFPALALCVILTTFVLGASLTPLPLAEYFGHPGIRNYLANIILFPNYFLPGLFANNTYPNAVNGSLWSLPVEFACYLLIMFIGFGRRGARAPFVFLAGCALFAISIWYYNFYQGPQIVWWGTDLGQATLIMPFFMSGAFLYAMRNHVPLRWDVSAAMVLGLVALDVFATNFPVQQITWIFVPYIVLTIGWANTPVLRRFGRFGDPSYGMYLYAFPVQQTIIQLRGNDIDYATLTVVATAVSAVLGFLSWKLLEKPALSLKPKLSANQPLVPVPYQ